MKHGSSPTTGTGRFSLLRRGRLFHTGGTLRYKQSKAERRELQKQARDLKHNHQGN